MKPDACGPEALIKQHGICGWLERTFLLYERERIHTWQLMKVSVAKKLRLLWSTYAKNTLTGLLPTRRVVALKPVSDKLYKTNVKKDISRLVNRALVIGPDVKRYIHHVSSTITNFITP